jgi:hypothetical protein
VNQRVTSPNKGSAAAGRTAQAGDQGVPARRGAGREPPLDLTEGLRVAATEVCAHVPELGHVRVPEVHFAVFYSRQARRTLTYARCYPLTTTVRKRGKRVYCLTPVVTPGGLTARYVLAFAWTRYWEMTPRERLLTLVHELYHVGPAFDGEARTFPSGGWHGRGRKWFDKVVEGLADDHLPPGFLERHAVLSLPIEGGTRVSFERLTLPRWVPKVTGGR